MNMKKSLKTSVIIITLSTLFSSCGTILSGGSPKITIDGNIDEPVNITTAKQTYNNVRLPYTVKVNRHKLDGQRIYIQSETTRYRDVILEKSTNGMTFVNILLGGLIGWCVDLGTNCVSKPAQTHFYINANDVQGQQPTQQNNNYNSGLGVDVP